MSGPVLLATSDLHVSHRGNRELVDQIRPTSAGDWLIVAGDVADTAAAVEDTLRVLSERFARVIWAPGNHELWTTPHDPVTLRGVDRYQYLVRQAQALGVVTPEDPFPVWTDAAGEQIPIVPLFLLYDYSWREPGTQLSAALEAARQAGVTCTDEFFLHADPYPGRQEWAEHRLLVSQQRLAQVPAAARPILVSHWPLHRLPTQILHHPQFAMWCGSERTQDWHRRYRAAAVVFGHLHIPMSVTIDGVPHHEVSVGYPREWKARPFPPPLVRQVWPAPTPAAVHDPDSLLTQLRLAWTQRAAEFA